MIVRLKVKSAGTITGWVEDYDAGSVKEPTHYGRRNPQFYEISNQKEAEAWGNALIDSFNDSLRSGEVRRELISATFRQQEPTK